jgi:hypothetical protein
VIVNLFSKYAALYPVPAHDAVTLATALFQYYCTYGVTERIISDPGSDLTAEVVDHLNKWFGVRHTFSLVGRHESNGVEGTNKQVLRHLRCLVADQRLINNWSLPTVLPLIQYMLNTEFVSSESGIVPLHAHFGNMDQIFQQLPEVLAPDTVCHDYVRELSSNIALVRAVCKDYQATLAYQRSLESPASAMTVYQTGDYVLKEVDQRPSKLHFQYAGPY